MKALYASFFFALCLIPGCSQQKQKRPVDGTQDSTPLISQDARSESSSRSGSERPLDELEWLAGGRHRFTCYFYPPAPLAALVQLRTETRNFLKKHQGLLPQGMNLDLQIILADREKISKYIELPAWMHALYDKGSIFILTSGDSEVKASDSRKRLWHELSHAILEHSSTGKIPPWLDEGLAMYLAEEGSGLQQLRLQAWLEQHRFSSLEELEAEFQSQDKERAQAAYSHAFLAGAYLYSKGEQRLQRLIFMLPKTPFKKAFESTYGQELAEFERELKTLARQSEKWSFLS